MVEYITRFDYLMIRCNIDEELVATLAWFWAGLRLEYQRELVLHEVTTLEKAYRYTTNMELYSSHAQRAGHAWSSSEQARARPVIPDTPTSLPLFPPSPSATGYLSPSALVLPPLPRPPLRLLLPLPRLRSPCHPRTWATEIGPEIRRILHPSEPYHRHFLQLNDRWKVGIREERDPGISPLNLRQQTPAPPILNVRGGVILPLNARLHDKLLAPHGHSSSRCRTRNIRLPMTPPRQQPKYTRRTQT